MNTRERKLYEALTFARDKIYRALCAQGELGDGIDPAETPTLKIIDAALTLTEREQGEGK